jgi:hypothetical protein
MQAKPATDEAGLEGTRRVPAWTAEQDKKFMDYIPRKTAGDADAPPVNNAGNGKILNCDNLNESWKTRGQRSVKVLLSGDHGLYSRKLFAAQLKKLDLLKNLEACGPLIKTNMWQLTFDAPEAKTRFIQAGDFEANGVKVSVSPPRPTNYRKNRYFIKMHWIPYEIPMQIAYEKIQRIPGIKIISAGYENSPEEGFQAVRTGVRLLTIETERAETIPYMSEWSYMGRFGKILITVKGRPPVCLKCEQVCHLKRECKAIICLKCHKIGHKTELCTTKLVFAAVLKGTADMVTEEVDNDCQEMELNIP